jgi:hypothetical protein
MAGRKKQRPPPHDSEQSARFIETAKALGADQNAASFKRSIKTLLSSKRKRARHAP